ncbi:MAG: carbon-nitrogen hydrolase family protein, partial [Clostridia bacterium]|nr:carbon-nitrogen hydrolase family protein [Clostridia bacterium]
MGRRAFRAAVIQMRATGERTANLATAARLVREAAQAGARLVSLPESFVYLGGREGLLA